MTGLENLLIKLLALLPVIAAAVFGIGLLILAYFALQGWLEEYRTIAQDLNGEVVSRFFFWRYVKVMNQGCEQRVELTTAGKNRPARLILSQLNAPDLGLFIEKEEAGTRMLKKLGLTHELQTGDEKFDKKCLIKTGDQERAAQFLSSPERRAIILDWITHGYQSVTIHKGVAIINKPGYSERELGAGPLQARLDQLRRLCSN